MPTPIVPSFNVEIKCFGYSDYEVYVDGEYLGGAKTYQGALAKADAYKWGLLTKQSYITPTA